MYNMWYMVNVVLYDGSDAYVSKFVLQVEEVNTDKEGTHLEVTKESQRRLGEYLYGNGEILKLDPLYYVDFESIIALKNLKDSKIKSEIELFTAYDRFKNMWF